MPPVQHTFGRTGNAPSGPGAGVVQPSSPPPQSPPSNSQFYSAPEAYNPVTSSTAPEAYNPVTSSTAPEVYNPVTSPASPGAGYGNVAPNPPPASYNPSYNPPYSPPFSPQQSASPYPQNYYYRPDDSPDLTAANRELIDLDMRIRENEERLNTQLNDPQTDPATIAQLQDSIRQQYVRKGALQQQVRDLQNPNSIAYQQSQQMTQNLEAGQSSNQNGQFAMTLPNAAGPSIWERVWRNGRNLRFIVIGIIIVGFIITFSIVWSRRRR